MFVASSTWNKCNILPIKITDVKYDFNYFLDSKYFLYNSTIHAGACSFVGLGLSSRSSTPRHLEGDLWRCVNNDISSMDSQRQ